LSSTQIACLSFPSLIFMFQCSNFSSQENTVSNSCLLCRCLLLAVFSRSLTLTFNRHVIILHYMLDNYLQVIERNLPSCTIFLPQKWQSTFKRD
jgi:hypothetical protein